MAKNTIKYFYNQTRNIRISNGGRQLCGRDFINPKELEPKVIKTILWTALDLKNIMRKRCREPLQMLKTKSVTLAFVKPSTRYQISFHNAATMLGASCTAYVDPDWSIQPDLTDNGKLLSRLTDVIVCNGLHQTDVAKLADGSSVPVINSCSSHYSLVKMLSDIMTFQEQFGYLKRLNVSWIGAPNALCNTYLHVLPMVGMNLKYLGVCAHGQDFISPINFPEALEASKKYKTNIFQATTLKEAVYKADIIGTCAHRQTEYTITLKVLDSTAAVNWYLIHSLPRTPVEVEDDVFYHKNNLVWNSVDNTTYVAMALLLQLQKEYKPVMDEPSFDGEV